MGLFKTKALSFLNPATFTSLPASFLSFFFFFLRIREIRKKPSYLKKFVYFKINAKLVESPLVSVEFFFFF